MFKRSNGIGERFSSFDSYSLCRVREKKNTKNLIESKNVTQCLLLDKNLKFIQGTGTSARVKIGVYIYREMM